jgi:hypothetical protein
MRIRANIYLDTDAYSFAAAYASAKGIPLGAAVSELLLRAEGSMQPPSPPLKKNSRGLLVRARSGRAVTPAMVKAASEDEVG